VLLLHLAGCRETNQNPAVGPIRCSNPDLINLIQVHLVAPPVVKLRGARAGVVGHGGRLLQCAAVPEISSDAGCPKAVVASPFTSPALAEQHKEFAWRYEGGIARPVLILWRYDAQEAC
jgi:hypothetical protein